GGRAHHLRARGGGDGARTRNPRRGGGGLPARRFVRQTPQADGRLGRALRQGRNGRGQGGCARSCANTAIASPKARGRVRGPPPDPTAVRLAPRRHITSAVKAVSDGPQSLHVRAADRGGWQEEAGGRRG